MSSKNRCHTGWEDFLGFGGPMAGPVWLAIFDGAHISCTSAGAALALGLSGNILAKISGPQLSSDPWTLPISAS